MRMLASGPTNAAIEQVNTLTITRHRHPLSIPLPLPPSSPSASPSPLHLSPSPCPSQQSQPSGGAGDLVHVLARAGAPHLQAGARQGAPTHRDHTVTATPAPPLRPHRSHDRTATPLSASVGSLCLPCCAGGCPPPAV
eukprot:551329-Prymnesium_polylepis.1